MTRRIAGSSQPTKSTAPHVLPIGHLSTKSSVYSPVSMSRMSQDLVFNHMKSHYQRISSAKACVDTSVPKSMKLTIKEKDRRRKEALLASNIKRTSSRPSSRQSNDHTGENGHTLNHIPGNDTARTTVSSRGHTTSTQTLREDSDCIKPALTDMSHLHTSLQREGWSDLKNQTLENDWEDHKTTDRLYTSTPRPEREEFEVDPNLGLSTMTFSYKSPPTRRKPRKKNPEEMIWTEEQKYLQFISDVTSDVLARGICSNRVINKVFESHIEKRKDSLDEANMREMINQLKDDLGVTDD